jgi:hypothetical protein
LRQQHNCDKSHESVLGLFSLHRKLCGVDPKVGSLNKLATRQHMSEMCDAIASNILSTNSSLSSETYNQGRSNRVTVDQESVPL